MSATATALPEIVRPQRLSPMERLEALCDPGSIRTIRSGAVSPKRS